MALSLWFLAFSPFIQDTQTLIEALGDPSIERREAAYGELQRRIRTAMPLLRKAAAESSDPTVRDAAKDLVDRHSAGALLWKYECPHGRMLITPHGIVGVSADIVCVTCGCGSGRLVGIGAVSGKVQWESQAGAGYHTHYTFCEPEKTVFASVNTGPDRLVAVDLPTGKTRWTLQGMKGLHRPIAAGQRVFVGGGDGVRAVDLKTGEVTWHFAAEKWVSTPTVGERLLWSPGNDGKVRALDRDSGKPAWEVGGFEQLSPISLAESALHFGGSDCLVALKPESGERIWECPVRGWSHDAPRVVGDVIYYSTQFMGEPLECVPRERHYAVGAATGKILREQEEPFPEIEREEPRARAIRLYSLEGGFPVLSGEFYGGPRRSAVVCRRGVDIDKE